MSRRRALLVDLDDTLVVEEPAAQAAFEATARHAATVCRCDADRLALDARDCAGTLWRAAPTHPYCQRIGISSWEGLWCRFEGDGGDLQALRAWAPGYRRSAWRDALAAQGIEDDGLAARLGDRFGAERRARHEVFADAREVLLALRGEWTLALVTNGASCLQREKLAASGLGGLFDAIVVAGDLGVAKPDPAVFRYALDVLGARADDSVMVGDSLERDVDGALAAGLAAVWLNRAPMPRDGRPELAGAPPGHARAGFVEISTLAELPAAVRALRAAGGDPRR